MDFLSVFAWLRLYVLTGLGELSTHRTKATCSSRLVSGARPSFQLVLLLAVFPSCRNSSNMLVSKSTPCFHLNSNRGVEVWSPKLAASRRSKASWSSTALSWVLTNQMATRVLNFMASILHRISPQHRNLEHKRHMRRFRHQGFGLPQDEMTWSVDINPHDILGDTE